MITREMRSQMEKENSKHPENLTALPSTDWPRNAAGCFLSRHFLVQLFQESRGVVRVSVNRTLCDSSGKWIEDISWEELMEIKRQIGFSDWYAIEVLPRDQDIVNVANMRHFWILDEPLNIGWLKK